jgi:polysaccharide export outer membrane protein
MELDPDARILDEGFGSMMGTRYNTMTRLKRASILCFALLSFAKVSYAQYVTHTLAPDPAHMATPDELRMLESAPLPPLVIHAGDSYTVSVLNAKDFNVKGRVASDGTIDLPLAGKLSVAGTTTEDAQAAIRERLRTADMVKAAQVVVSIDSSPTATVSITGEVNHADAFPAYGRRTLGDYLSQAGGLKPTGSSIVTLVRPGLPSPIQLDLGTTPSNSEAGAIPLFAGDTVIVPSTGLAYAVGALRAQGVFPLKNTGPTTVLQLVAMANGVGYEGALNSSVIVRKTPQGLKEVPVRLGDILRHRTHDIALQADDILYVPTDKAKAAIKGGATGLAVALATAYVYTR